MACAIVLFLLKVIYALALLEVAIGVNFGTVQKEVVAWEAREIL